MDRVITLESFGEEAATEPDPEVGEALERHADAEDVPKDSAESEPGSVTVFVCGCVNNPGVYSFSEGSRVNDALTAAGGFDEAADREYLNLARVLQDGEKCYFPSCEETILWKTSGFEEHAARLQTEGEDADGRINLNTATKSELCGLPGIGEVKAEAILSYRQEQGRFSSADEVKQVKGIGDSLYHEIQDYIYVK